MNKKGQCPVLVLRVHGPMRGDRETFLTFTELRINSFPLTGPRAVSKSRHYEKVILPKSFSLLRDKKNLSCFESFNFTG